MLRDQITLQADGRDRQILGQNRCKYDVKKTHSVSHSQSEYRSHTYGHERGRESSFRAMSVEHHTIDTQRKQSLFTTLKFSRFIPATLQQDHLLLTHVRLSDLLTGQTVHQLVTFEHESMFTFTLTCHSLPSPLHRLIYVCKAEHRGNLILPP